MPFIKIATNVDMGEEKRALMARKIAENITLLPGKTPERTMVEIEDGKTMLFGCSFDPCMKARVELFGHSPAEAKAALARVLTELAGSEAGVAPDRVYITFPEYGSWGSGGALRIDDNF